MRWLALPLACAACSITTDPRPDPDVDTGVAVQEVVSGLASPVFLTAPAGDDRLFIVEQPGRIRIMDPSGALLQRPFLDLTDRVGSTGNEQGLLGLAFHPQYAQNGRFYVYYTDAGGDSRVERYTVSTDPDSASRTTAFPILSVAQPFGNHNGGMLLFGEDGMLYIGLGDGGSGGDPQGHGQNRNTLLGSLLRIDVDGGSPYAIPPDNPFVGIAGTRPEIWAYGLRNPWRFALDAQDDLIYIADVGQNAWEEVNVEDAADGGLNYGWNIMEGAHCYNASSCNQTGLVLPAVEYSHAEGCSVTGGFVYRGSDVPGLAGRYVYGDFCQGWVRSFRFNGVSASDPLEHDVGDVGNILSFGLDADNELYVLSGNGRVYRFVAAPEE